MRFLHTADWHLGRLFHGTHLTDDQAFVLDQIVDICRDQKLDAVLVAGDIYDRAVPPPEAVGLLDEVLCRVVLGSKLPVVLIAGNHDSPGRLHFGSKLLEAQCLHVRGNVSAACAAVRFHDSHGPVDVYPIPYAEPATVRSCLAAESVTDHDSGMRAMLAGVREKHAAGVRSILIAHAFVAGATTCDSERPLSVGGAGTVDAGCFGGFDYVALGHLHGAQRVSTATGVVQYSGSPLKYSFDEAAHIKSVAIVEMAGDGTCAIETIPLKARRDVRRIRGTVAELLQTGSEAPGREDYLEVTLLDSGAVFDAVGRLREVYPNVAELKRLDLRENPGAPTAAADHRKMSDLELFRAFYTHVAGKGLEAAEEGAFVGVIEEMNRREREAVSLTSATAGKKDTEREALPSSV